MFKLIVAVFCTLAVASAKPGLFFSKSINFGAPAYSAPAYSAPAYSAPAQTIVVKSAPQVHYAAAAPVYSAPAPQVQTVVVQSAPQHVQYAAAAPAQVHYVQQAAPAQVQYVQQAAPAQVEYVHAAPSVAYESAPGHSVQTYVVQQQPQTFTKTIGFGKTW